MKFYGQCVELRKDYLNDANLNSIIKCRLLSKLVSIYFSYGSKDTLPINKVLCVYCGDILIANDRKLFKDCLSQVLSDLGYNNHSIDGRHYDFNKSFELIIRP